MYASKNLIQRRFLWTGLQNVIFAHLLPWALIEDFNATIGTHEHRGKHSPARRPMADFKNWSDTNNLIHFRTLGSRFTWSNNRYSSMSMERQLDKLSEICVGLISDLTSQSPLLPKALPIISRSSLISKPMLLRW